MGAGAVTRCEDLDAAAAAGAQFAASPGTTAELLGAARSVAIPFLPGMATASELMAGRLAGFTRFRLFPAREAGGPSLVSAFAEAFPEAVFCPAGGDRGRLRVCVPRAPERALRRRELARPGRRRRRGELEGGERARQGGVRAARPRVKTGGQRRGDSRNALGVVPVMRRKVTEKWLGVANPVRSAIW